MLCAHRNESDLQTGSVKSVWENRPQELVQYLDGFDLLGEQALPCSIIEVAEKLFRHIGHSKTTVSDIADELGTSRANVYRYFPTRSSINHCVYARWAQRELEVMRDTVSRLDDAHAKLSHALIMLNRRIRQRIDHDPHAHALWMSAALENWSINQLYFRELTASLVSVMLDDASFNSLPVPEMLSIANGVVTAMIAYLHPVLVEQRCHMGKDIEADLRAQIQFILGETKLSGRSFSLSL